MLTHKTYWIRTTHCQQIKTRLGGSYRFHWARGYVILSCTHDQGRLKIPMCFLWAHRGELVRWIAIDSAIRNTHFAAEFRDSFTSRPVLFLQTKAKLPVDSIPFCVYQLTCTCGASYADRNTGILSYQLKNRQTDISINLVESNHHINPEEAFHPVYNVRETNEQQRFNRLSLTRTEPSNWAVNKQLHTGIQSNNTLSARTLRVILMPMTTSVGRRTSGYTKSEAR